LKKVLAFLPKVSDGLLVLLSSFWRVAALATHLVRFLAPPEERPRKGTDGRVAARQTPVDAFGLGGPHEDTTPQLQALAEALQRTPIELYPRVRRQGVVAVKENDVLEWR
jgi:hypothetical protein